MADPRPAGGYPEQAISRHPRIPGLLGVILRRPEGLRQRDSTTFAGRLAAGCRAIEKPA
jgi:hypothetical protein